MVSLMSIPLWEGGGRGLDCCSLPTEFTFNQTPIKYVLDLDPIRFLGKPIGFQLINDHSQVKEFYEKAYKILGSFLTHGK